MRVPYSYLEIPALIKKRRDMKNITSLSVAILLTLATFGAPARAITNNDVPLRVKDCAVGYIGGMGPGARNGLTNGVTVTVVNVSSEAITAFTGGGPYNGTLVVDSITHTIDPGKSYTFTKFHRPFFYSGSSATCSVWKVHFADGTDWVSPDKPASVK